jgi:hypothetical protein
VSEVNTAPVLGEIGDQTGAEGTVITFTATATDSDIPANTWTFSLVGAPAGASIDPNTGAFNWTPTEAEGPGDFTFTVHVSDNGSPNLNDEEAITITVTEINTAPVLASIGNKVGDEGTAMTFTASAADNDLPANTLTFSLESAPAGATIDPDTGAFTWTPTEAQGEGDYTFIIRVTDNGTPALNDFEEITVLINEVNAAPVLGTVGSQTGTTGAPVTFTASAADSDLPAQTLTFSLDSGAPAGATIDSKTGVFTWTPTTAGTFQVTIRVTDDGDPALDDFETITITVTEEVVYLKLYLPVTILAEEPAQ